MRFIVLGVFRKMFKTMETDRVGWSLGGVSVREVSGGCLVSDLLFGSGAGARLFWECFECHSNVFEERLLKAQ